MDALAEFLDGMAVGVPLAGITFWVVYVARTWGRL